MGVDMYPLSAILLFTSIAYFSGVSTALAQSLVIFSCFILGESLEMFILATVTILALSLGLTSLAVGLGAMTPNFREDNPARIANGLGGTMNVVLSLLYVGGVLALEGTLFMTFKTRAFFSIAAWSPYLAGCAVGLVVMHACAIILPMRFGLSRWRAMEF